MEVNGAMSLGGGVWYVVCGGSEGGVGGRGVGLCWGVVWRVDGWEGIFGLLVGGLALFCGFGE